METNGDKQKHGRNKKTKKNNEEHHKEFVPHNRTKSYYGSRPQSSGSSRQSNQSSTTHQQLFLSPHAIDGNFQQSTTLHVPQNVPIIKHDNIPIDDPQDERDTLKVQPYSKHGDKRNDHKKQKEVKKETLKVEIPTIVKIDERKEHKVNSPRKATESGSKKQSEEIANQNSRYIISVTNAEAGNEQRTGTDHLDSGTRNARNVTRLTENGRTKQHANEETDKEKKGNQTKDKNEKDKDDVSRRGKHKVQLRRCASVDVAELHRKKKGKKSSKKKVDKDIFLALTNSGQPQADAQTQRSSSVGKRPNSLKLLTDQTSTSQTVFPTPNTQKRNSSVSKDGKRPNNNAVAPKIEVYDQSPQQFRTQTSTEDRLRKISVDFSSLDEIPHAEGYRRHGLKHNFPSSPYYRIKPPRTQNVSLRIFGITIYTIVAFMVFCPMAAILLVLVPLGVLFKCSLKCCSCCCSRGQGQECVCCICGENLSITEKFWIQNDQLNPKVVQSLIIVEYGLSAAQIINLINTRLVLASSEFGGRLYPRFSQKVVRTCSEYVWVADENFFIHDHVFTMPKGIESVVDLQEYVSDMASQPLSFSTALWEVQIVTNFGEQQDSVLLFRMHPCLADGVSLVKILYKSIADVDSVTTVPPKFAQRSCLDSLRSLFYGPLLFIDNFMCSRSDFNLLHGKHIHLSGKKLITWSEPFSLSAAIRIKQVTRSSLSEVLMSVAAGSIRSYLQLNGIPHPFDMHCSIPVYTGSNVPSIVANHVILLKLSIPTNTEGVIPRLWQMKERMIEAKHSSFYSLTRKVFKYSYHVLPESLWNCMWQKITDKCSCVISCLPGPEIGLRLASKQIKTIFYWYPHVHSVPLTISFFTYGDHVQMAVSTDSAVLPNPDILTKDFIYQVINALFLVFVLCSINAFKLLQKETKRHSHDVV